MTTLREAHSDLIGRLTITTPHRIVPTPDAADFEERAAHVSEVLDHVRDYLIAVATDTSSNMTTKGTHLPKMIECFLSDLQSELTAPMTAEAERLRERVMA